MERVLGKFVVPRSDGHTDMPTATTDRGFTNVCSLWPGILGGLLLSLPGLIPAIVLDWGVDRATAQAAHYIYVFDRLPHHLTLTGIRPDFIVRLALLWAFWLLLGSWNRRHQMPEDRREPLFPPSGLCRPGPWRLRSWERP